MRIALVLTCFLALAACEGPSVRTEAVSPIILKILDRHDLYVESDTTLSPLETETYLHSSEIVRELFKPRVSPILDSSE